MYEVRGMCRYEQIPTLAVFSVSTPVPPDKSRYLSATGFVVSELSTLAIEAKCSVSLRHVCKDTKTGQREGHDSDC